MRVLCAVCGMRIHAGAKRAVAIGHMLNSNSQRGNIVNPESP